jgi:hypothetical protein
LSRLRQKDRPQLIYCRGQNRRVLKRAEGQDITERELTETEGRMPACAEDIRKSTVKDRRTDSSLRTVEDITERVQNETEGQISFLNRRQNINITDRDRRTDPSLFRGQRRKVITETEGQISLAYCL